MPAVVQIEGLRGLVRATRECEAELDEWLRHGMLEIAGRVAVDVRSVYSGYSAVGAAAIREKMTKPGNALVAQTLRRSRTQGRRRGNFGPLMMRKAFMPALEQNAPMVEEEAKKLFDKLAERWGE